MVICTKYYNDLDTGSQKSVRDYLPKPEELNVVLIFGGLLSVTKPIIGRLEQCWKEWPLNCRFWNWYSLSVQVEKYAGHQMKWVVIQ